jgi:hypothetical protein
MKPQPTPRATSRRRIPLTPADQAHPAPTYVFALVPEGQIDASLLNGLAAALAAQGTPLQAQRMRFDRHYALERLAQAHCSPDAPTRQLAMRLFDAYQGSAVAPGGRLG